MMRSHLRSFNEALQPALCLALLCSLLVSSKLASAASSFDMRELTSNERRLLVSALDGRRVRVGLDDGALFDVLLAESYDLGLYIAREGVSRVQVLPWDKLVSLERLDWADGQAPDPSLPALIHRLHIEGGEAILGRILEINEERCLFVSPEGNVRQIERGSLRAMHPFVSGSWLGSEGHESEREYKEGLSGTRHHRTRYFFAKSAKPLGQAEGLFSQKELAFSEFSYGLTDELSLFIGALVPAWFAPKGFQLFLGMGAGFELREDLYLSATLQGALLPGWLAFQDEYFGALNIGSTLTWGPDDMHVSLGLMIPMFFDDAFFEVHPVVIVAGVLELEEWLALVSEHWIAPTMIGQDSLFGGQAHMLGFRVMFGGLAFDLAALYMPTLPDSFPLVPWVDVTYHWGTRVDAQDMPRE